MWSPKRNEVHIVLAPNGHHMSTDCWCEPTLIYWRQNIHGVPILVVEHDDNEDLTIHHSGVIYARDRAQDWVTRLLSAVPPYPSPPDPNERKLP